MNGLHAAQVLQELRIPCASSKPSGTGVPQHISGTAHYTAVVKLNSAVLVTNLSDFTCDALHTPEPKPAITGLAVSPCSSMVAAYSTDCIYVAQLNGAGQLQKAGQLPGVKAVHWCPGRAVLAVFCQQADPVLLVLAEHQADRAPTATFPLQRLPGPRTAASGARCATWLPTSSSSMPHEVAAALLVAWPSDVLLYCWSHTAHGAVNWKHPRVHKFLTGWPGPARTLAALPATHINSTSNTSSSTADSNSTTCIVLGAVDAQLSLEAQDNCQLEQQQGSCAAGSDGLVQPLPSGNQRAHSGGGGGGVLSRLLNIHHHAGVNTAAGLNGSSSSSSRLSSVRSSMDSGVPPLSSACLCMLQIKLADYSTDSRRRSLSGMGPNDGPAAAGKQFVAALKLEHLPLPNILAVYGDIVAVASTKGPPVVTLCTLSSTVGLQLLQTVSIPLPAAAGPDVTKARLEGIVLAAQQQQQQQQPGYAYDISSSSSDVSSSSSLFPGVDLAGGGSFSALLSAPRLSVDKANQHHLQQQQQQLLPNVVALVTCSTGQPETGHFASFDNNTGASTAAAAGETYLLSCKVAPLATQQQRQREEISAYPPASPRQQQQVLAHAAYKVIQHQSGRSSDAAPKQQQQQQQQPPQQQQAAIAVLSPREHAVAPSPGQQSPMLSPRQQSPLVSPQQQIPMVSLQQQSPLVSPVSPRQQSPLVSPVSPRQQSPLVSPVSPRQQSPLLSPVSPRQQRASCNGVAYTVLHKASAGQLPSPAASPRQQQQQQYNAVQPQPQQQQQKRGSDGSCSSSSYASTASSPRSGVVHRCPWLRNMQVKEDEEEEQRLQEAAAAKAAATKSSSNLLLQQQQQQLEALQQQMHCFLQQQTAESRLSGSRLDKLVKCVTAVQATIQQQSAGREFLDATGTALGKLQSTMECILAALQQQQQREVSEAVAAPEAAEMVSVLQNTMESLLQSMQEQQQLLQDSVRSPVAAAAGGPEGVAATESFGKVQATLDNMLQLMQQQNHYSVTPAAPAEGLETSSAAALDRMQSTLEQVLQVLQQQQQQLGTVSPSAAAATDSPESAAAFSKMQSTMEGVLTTLQQQQQQQAVLLAREPAPAAVTAAAFSTLQASLERLTDTLEQHQKQQQDALQAAQKQQAAVTTAALANLQVSLESRLDSMLHQQQLLLQEAREKDQTVVGAMAQLQCGIERKLDAMHHTLKDMVVKLAGLEEELAELEQQQ